MKERRGAGAVVVVAVVNGIDDDLVWINLFVGSVILIWWILREPLAVLQFIVAICKLIDFYLMLTN